MPKPHSTAAARVGRLVKACRHRVGLSARKLAECAELDLTHVQRIERGQANPTLITLLHIAVALEVDLGELVTGLTAEDLPPGRLPYGHSRRHLYRRGMPWEPTVYLGDDGDAAAGG